MTGLDPIYVESVVKTALSEDIGSGDITTALTIPENAANTAEMISKQEGIIAGLPVAEAVFRTVDSRIKVIPAISDGETVKPGDKILDLSGPTRSLLTSERVALNFLQRLSGIATITAEYASEVSGTKARIVDTRKTTPGLRALEKYAVTVGGGFNHRFGLSDGILIKDNHIAGAGGIISAITAARRRAPHTLKIEVEITHPDQLETAIKAGADIVMLDNMSLDDIQQAVKAANGRVLLEASGGVNLKTVRQIAETGVDIISVGALTHSAPALDISMNIALDNGHP